MKFLFLIILSLMLAGCAPSFWFNPNKSKLETQKDTRDCDYEALKYSREGSGRNELLYQKCMENKGYRLVNEYTITRKGNEFFFNKQYEEALKYYDRAAYDNPDTPFIYHNMATCYYYLKKYDSALKNFEKAISLEPNFSLAYVGRGLVKMNKNSHDKAFSDFEKANSLDPKSPYPHMGKGMYFYDKKKFLEAKEELNKSVSLARKESEVDESFYYLGLTHLKLKDKAEALENFKKSCDFGHTEACSQYKIYSRE